MVVIAMVAAVLLVMALSGYWMAVLIVLAAALIVFSLVEGATESLAGMIITMILLIGGWITWIVLVVA